MASLIPQTKKLLIERIRRHIANDFPSSDFNVSENETLLYIDQALASTIVGQVFQQAKLEGTIVMPEAYLSTYLLPNLSKDSITGYWTTTLPQPPLSLPLGYSITRGYFASAANGVGNEIIWIKSKRVSRRRNMPMQSGVRGWVEGSKLYLMASNNSPLGNLNLYVTMAKSRTENIDEVMNMPDDAVEIIFNNVVAKLLQRMQIPHDVIQDDLPAGATNITNK